MKIVIDPDKCQGHTLCAAAAPKIFGLREEDGHAYVMAEDIPPELEPSALRASEACPEGAILIADGDADAKVLREGAPNV